MLELPCLIIYQYIIKHAGNFKNSREMHRESRSAAESFLHFSSVLENSMCLNYSTINKEQGYLFFTKNVYLPIFFKSQA